MLKKKYLLFILIISIFLISAVSAEDINSSDEITSIDDVNLIKKRY